MSSLLKQCWDENPFSHPSFAEIIEILSAYSQDVFDSMRVRKDETTIHWHDFIAAGLSQCAVDDRNLRLAFGRLDQKGKGHIYIDKF
jgi:hypothetical protein